jgi:hypothetical protein
VWRDVVQKGGQAGRQASKVLLTFDSDLVIVGC